MFKAILTSDEPGVDDSVAIESVFLHNNKAVDLVLGGEEMRYLEESPGSSPDSSIVSESGDPLYDETLLKDLFYTTPVSYVLAEYVLILWSIENPRVMASKNNYPPPPPPEKDGIFY